LLFSIRNHVKELKSTKETAKGYAHEALEEKYAEEKVLLKSLFQGHLLLRKTPLMRKVFAGISFFPAVGDLYLAL
jgi:hypothetical protein